MMKTRFAPLITCSTVVWARQAPSAEQPTSTGQQSSTVSEAPVPGPEPSEKAIARYRSGVALWLIDTAWGFILPAAILLTGFSSRMRTWATRISRKRVLTIAIYFAIFSIVTFVIDLPRAYYVVFVREHAYGLSNQTLGKWASDQAAALGVTLVIGALVLWVPYLLLARSPRRWWLYTAMLAVPFIIVIQLVQPLWIDPLFNRFGPMKDKALEAEGLRLADRAGIEGGRVFEVAKSEDTKAVNAYVNGFGATTRIVLWDTILEALDRPQLMVVMGHEMGHYVLNHIWRLMGMTVLIVLLLLYAVYRVSGALIDRYGGRFGFATLADVASLPLILLVASLVSLVTDPLALAYARHLEHEADRFALEITRDNHAAATAFVILQQENLGVPRPGWLYTWFRENHPPLGERIDFSNDYRPWETNQPLVYADRFK
jgi:Zn-dependent protease with chaperone function